MRVRLLGTIAVDHGRDGERPVAPPRPRRILALLGSKVGDTVSESALVEGIWPDGAPGTARTALQTYVSALRDMLEPDRPRRDEGSFVHTRPEGYVLAPSPQIDVVRFESLIDEARRTHVVNPDRAVELLQDAERLWRDPPFGDLAAEPWALAPATRLRELRAGALESRFGLVLEHGDAATVVGEIDAVIHEHPYRERLAGQLMLALYRCGDQRDALRVAADLRARLRDDLGLEPGRETRLLERAILEHAPSLTRRSAVATAGRSPIPSSEAPPPPMVGHMVGRAGEREHLLAALGEHRVVTVLGPGGIGKTTLATVVADDQARSATVASVDLATVGTNPRALDVARVIARALGIVEHPLAPLDDTIGDALDEEPTLLVLHTCEVAVDTLVEVLPGLLAAPGLRILCTSQAPLRLADEYVCRLPPLPLTEAVELLERASRATDPAHGSNDSTREQLGEIAELLGRMPLALELAAGRLRALGAPELVRQLRDGSDLLHGGVDRPVRHRSVDATAEWSLGLLDPTSRRVAETLAVFHGSFTASLAAALMSADDADADPGASDRGGALVPAGQLAAIIADLVDRSLLDRVDHHESTRFRMLDRVRDVARRRAVTDGLHDPAHRRLAHSVLMSARAAAVDRPSSVSAEPKAVALSELVDEVVPALDTFAADGDGGEVELAATLGTFWIEHGRISEGRERIAAALARHPDAPPLMRAVAAMQASFLAFYQGDDRATRRLLGELIELTTELGIPLLRDAVLGCHAFVERRYDDARRYLDDAVAAGRGRSKQQMLLLHMAGNVAWYGGDRAAAAEHYRAQRRLAEEADDRFHLAQAVRFEGMVAVQLGDLDTAARRTHQSLTMADQLGDPISRSQSNAAATVVAWFTGDVEAVARHAVAALEASRRHFDVFALRTTLPLLADLHRARGEAERAARLFGWYIDLLERTGQAPSVALAGASEEIEARLRSALGSEFAAECGRGAALGFGSLLELATAS